MNAGRQEDDGKTSLAVLTAWADLFEWASQCDGEQVEGTMR